MGRDGTPPVGVGADGRWPPQRRADWATEDAGTNSTARWDGTDGRAQGPCVATEPRVDLSIDAGAGAGYRSLAAAATTGTPFSVTGHAPGRDRCSAGCAPADGGAARAKYVEGERRAELRRRPRRRAADVGCAPAATARRRAAPRRRGRGGRRDGRGRRRRAPARRPDPSDGEGGERRQGGGDLRPPSHDGVGRTSTAIQDALGVPAEAVQLVFQGQVLGRWRRRRRSRLSGRGGGGGRRRRGRGRRGRQCRPGGRDHREEEERRRRCRGASI